MFRSPVKTRLKIFPNGEITRKHPTLHFFWCNKTISEVRRRQNRNYAISDPVRLRYKGGRRNIVSNKWSLPKRITIEISETSDLSLFSLY